MFHMSLIKIINVGTLENAPLTTACFCCVYIYIYKTINQTTVFVFLKKIQYFK